MSSQVPLFVTMGMFIIDEIHFNNHRPSVYNVIGGAGTYGVVGARLFLAGCPQRIGWIVDCGSDFPDSVKQEIEHWQTGVVFRTPPDWLTTRGWNSYGSNEERAFRYTTPKLRIEVEDLIYYGLLVQAKSFHIICSPNRCIDITAKLSRRRSLNGQYVIWEPVPDECKPENWSACLDALRSVDILTPNAKEAAMFFDMPEPVERDSIEQLARKYIDHLKPGAALVLRCGSKGCLLLSTQIRQWYPAYHSPEYSDFKVVDPTGGGNSFVGGLAAGLVLSGGDLEVAAIYGNIAASFAIEQIGMPKLVYGDRELWNGQTVDSRIKAYCERYGFEESHIQEKHNWKLRI